jgi:hypothetical protein
LFVVAVRSAVTVFSKRASNAMMATTCPATVVRRPAALKQEAVTMVCSVTGLTAARREAALFTTVWFAPPLSAGLPATRLYRLVLIQPVPRARMMATSAPAMFVTVRAPVRTPR